MPLALSTGFTTSRIVVAMLFEVVIRAKDRELYTRASSIMAISIGRSASIMMDTGDETSEVIRYDIVRSYGLAFLRENLKGIAAQGVDS